MKEAIRDWEGVEPTGFVAPDEDDAAHDTAVRIVRAGIRLKLAAEAALAELERVKLDDQMANGCLSMILDALRALDQEGYDGAKTPPMMYDDWIKAIVRREQAEVARLKAVIEGRREPCPTNDHPASAVMPKRGTDAIPRSGPTTGESAATAGDVGGGSSGNRTDAASSTDHSPALDALVKAGEVYERARVGSITEGIHPASAVAIEAADYLWHAIPAVQEEVGRLRTSVTEMEANSRAVHAQKDRTFAELRTLRAERDEAITYLRSYRNYNVSVGSMVWEGAGLLIDADDARRSTTGGSG